MRTLSIFIVALLAGNCIEPYKLPELYTEPVLVFDGLITTDPGPHTVKLSMSLSPNLTWDKIPVSGAILSIQDNFGSIVNMVEAEPGSYNTIPSDWGAVIGRSYILLAELPDGNQYKSTEQKIYPAGSIDSLFATYSTSSIINVNDPALSQDAFSLFLNGSGELDYPNLFRWRWKGTYEIFTRPELKTRVIPGCCIVPDPLPCSGYNLSMELVGPCTCCTCWVNEFSIQARVSANQTTNNNIFSGVGLAKIPADGLRFYNKYHVEVEQLSLDETSYQFWKLVQSQQAGATNIFQPNVVGIPSNIRNVNNVDDNVMGLVSFADVTRKSLTIYRNQIVGKNPSLPLIIADCREYHETSTATKPSFW